MLYMDIRQYARFAGLGLVLTMFTGCGGGHSSSTSLTGGGDVGTPALVSAEISWQAPTTHDDMSPLLDLAGHNIYVDDGNGVRKIITINNPGITAYVVGNLVAGSYKFIVTAFDSQGVESSYSNEAYLIIDA